MSSLLDEMTCEFEEDDEFDWSEHWKDMPEYDNKKISPYKTLIVHFKTKKDFEEFSKLIEQNLSNKTKSIYYPVPNKSDASKYRYVNES